MTTESMFRPMAFLATLAASIAIATVAWAAGADPQAAAHRAAAVVADADTPAAQVDRAVVYAAARGGIPTAQVTIRRTGGPLEATADVAAVAADAPAVIAAIGPDARAAVQQAESAELAPTTVWATVR